MDKVQREQSVEIMALTSLAHQPTGRGMNGEPNQCTGTIRVPFIHLLALIYNSYVHF